MFYVYVLKNSISGKHYIGSTNNLERRLSEHKRGQTKSTRRNGVWMLIYKEKFSLISEATKRERQIKSYKGGNAFKKLVKER